MAVPDKNKDRGGKLFRWILIIIIAISAVYMGRLEYKIYQLKKETEATRARVEELQKVQADLEAERQRLYDPKYIEKLAREDHNMVGKNEVPLFIVKDKKQAGGKEDPQAKGQKAAGEQGSSQEGKKDGSAASKN
ncbi:MAG: septum formation initiator family protein [Succiniclasticum sp.]|jgi:cell division protein FtsL|nr:septum formation initiator family protein [Succiniclasticum sp.]MEE3479034.1 septum formation initiator family protein [Succiniclasticum sp.]